MNSSLNNEIKINPKDIYKISPELILNIKLKDGSILILDESIPSQDINNLIKNNYKSINININNSYTKDNINGKTLEMNEINEINESYIIKDNNYNQDSINNNTNFNFYSQNINQNNFEKRNSQNKSISDLVTEKLHKKYYSLENSKVNTAKMVKTTVNSEININIKGNDTNKKYLNNLMKDFDELLLNFNDKKKGLNNNQNTDNSQKKYKYYKKINSKKNDKFFLDDLSELTSNTKAIKYIGRNDTRTNATIMTDTNKNFFIGYNKNRLSFLKEKTLKRNKSNNYYLLKNDRIISDIISPPNRLCYNKISFIKNN